MLEVIALTPDDARAASDGGADRLELVGTMADDGLSPTPAVVERVVAASAVPVRAMVRSRAGFRIDPAEPLRLAGLAHAFADAGAAGLVLGFLDDHGRLDLAAVSTVVEAIDLPWTFHRAIDHAADPEALWAEVSALPRLDQVLTAGSPDGVDAGMPRLLGRAAGGPAASGMLLVGGGLRPEHLPVLRSAGVRGFHIGGAARPDRSFEATVDAAQVARWRALVGDSS